MNRRVETLMSLVSGVLIGSALLVGLAVVPVATQRPATDFAITTEMLPALLLSIEADPYPPGAASPTFGVPRAGRARLHWTAQDWRCARHPAIESPDLLPWRLASAPLELSTRVPDRF